MGDLHIVEQILGYYSYHLSETGKSGKPTLCGRDDVMLSHARLDSWGHRGHLRERYCAECEAKAAETLKVSPS